MGYKGGGLVVGALDIHDGAIDVIGRLARKRDDEVGDLFGLGLTAALDLGQFDSPVLFRHGVVHPGLNPARSNSIDVDAVLRVVVARILHEGFLARFRRVIRGGIRAKGPAAVDGCHNNDTAEDALGDHAVRDGSGRNPAAD